MLLILLLNWSSTLALNFLIHPTIVTFHRGDKCSHIERNIYECYKILLTILSYCKDGSFISACISFKISDVLLASNFILLVCFPFIKLTQISKFVNFKELRISSDMSLLILCLEIWSNLLYYWLTLQSVHIIMIKIISFSLKLLIKELRISSDTSLLILCLEIWYNLLYYWLTLKSVHVIMIKLLVFHLKYWLMYSLFLNYLNTPQIYFYVKLINMLIFIL